MRPILKGSTDQSVIVRIVDSGDGTPETGVTSATSGLDLKYRREGAATANLTESDLSALTDAHSDGGMLHIGAGYYRVDVPDAAFASGADGVLIFGSVTGMVVIGAYHPLVAFNPQDAVRLGLTALPNAAADAAGGLPISDTGGLDLDARLDAAVSSRASQASVDDVPTNAELTTALAAADDAVLAAVAGVQSDTNDIQTRLPAALGANGNMKADVLDWLGAAVATPTVAGVPQVDLVDILGVPVNPTGTVEAVVVEVATDVIDADALNADAVAEIQSGLSTLTQANVRSAVGLASANLDTQLGDLPTNAELATALAAADDAVLAAIAALNNLSQANVRAAIGLASANLDTQLGDLPTNAELATALAAADDATLAAIAALNNLSQANIRTAIGLASANLDTQLAALSIGASGTVADASATTTAFDTSLTQGDDFFNGAFLLFTSGALLGQSRLIEDFADAGGRVTLASALTAAPANGVSFLILGRAESA